MSSTLSAQSDFQQPDWLWGYLGFPAPTNGELVLSDQRFAVARGIPRSELVRSDTQAQTEKTFGFKWKKRDTFESDAALTRMRQWLIERYGDMASAKWLGEHGHDPLIIDAGCGGGLSGIEVFAPIMDRIRYFGIDVSEAVDVAAARFAERSYHNAAFMQADIANLPLPEASVDIIFSEGVLHHTDSTRGALANLTRLLKPGGRFMFYVYKTKGPVREFVDDYIRDKLQAMSPQEAWDAMEPLTRLGIALGELDAEIDIPEAINLLEIPAGRINIQRLFYWHVAKMFYRPDHSLDELNHINYDWYAPANAARQSPEEVREWCDVLELKIEREIIEDAGITIIAKKGV